MCSLGHGLWAGPNGQIVSASSIEGLRRQHRLLGHSAGSTATPLQSRSQLVWKPLPAAISRHASLGAFEVVPIMAAHCNSIRQAVPGLIRQAGAFL